MPETKNITLEHFAQKLLEEKGLKDVDDEVLAEMQKDLLERLQDKINAELIAALPPEKLEELDKITDNKDTKDVEVQKFFVENIADFPEKFTGILMGFRKTYLGL